MRHLVAVAQPELGLAESEFARVTGWRAVLLALGWTGRLWDWWMFVF